MPVSPEEVRHVAELARLELDESEVELYTEHLSAILDHAAKIKEIDTSGVEPTSHPLRLANVWREDVPRPGLDPEVVLKEAPDTEAKMFKVPRIMEIEELPEE
jgi:aspartyl-tRNA(Asn)/glutamyl-tRNA(Gln) amidotransferase subunit C